ncbi:MAG: GNAT family N-acetyltransferase [Dehalococcoidales bacterium]|nr:GNAT family N-acetyltransferase [Dehalococcoidales bacterium]
MAISVRPLVDRDKSDVMRILRATSEFKPSEVAIAEELIDSYLCDSVQSGYHILVAEVDRSVIGYICYGPTPLTEGTWDVYWIAVATDRQSQGTGGALMTFAEAKIAEAQGRLVIVETSSVSGYEKTRHFYHRQGYEVICRIPDFYTPGDDKIILQKRLR